MRKVAYAGHTVTFPDVPDQENFFSILERGEWDNELFEFIRANTDRHTVFIDVGAWIGVTPFWAAQRVQKVIAVEPDPVCVKLLQEMQGMNPGNVVVQNAALATGNSLKVGSVGGFGSSMTSALAANNADAIIASGVSLQSLLDQADGAPIFLKIDIEGYEYYLCEQLKQIKPNQVRAISLAIHPVEYARSLSSNRRISAVRETARLIRSFPQYDLLNWRALLAALGNLVSMKQRRQHDLEFVSNYPTSAPIGQDK